MNEPKRLLCIVPSMDTGGAETFLMKIYRKLDKTQFQMDFYVGTKKEGFYDKEILSMGGKIYYGVAKSKGLIKSFVNIRDVVKSEKYDIVLRISQHSLSVIDLLAAKCGGATRLIFRSSNSKTGGNLLSHVLHLLFKWLPKRIPNVKIAPSKVAAEFVFGKRSLDKGEVIILNNAIDLNQFAFKQDIRDRIREELNINDKLVIGHVGRFAKQKNHEFLIDIFAEIVKIQPNSVLLLVGNGDLLPIIKEKVTKLQLNDKVIFTDVRSDVNHILMGMDIFVFPSFFEGMPNTIIEAQATGLPCVISNTITEEVKITNLVNFMSLNDKAELWAKKTLETVNKYNNRKQYIEILDKAGYNIDTVIEKFINIIFK